jgi:hypothetical protein
MRTLIAVAVMAALGAAAVAAAEEGGIGSDGLLCSERCDVGYQSCMRSWNGKAARDCPGEFIRCRDACAPPAMRAAAKAGQPFSCRETCQADFDACLRRNDGKHTEACARAVMVCRNACPQEPKATAAGGQAAAKTTAFITKAAHSAAETPRPPKASPSPVSATTPGRTTATEASGPARGEVHSMEAAQATADDAATSVAGVPEGAGAQTPRSGVWARLWCAVGGSCRSNTQQSSMSCDDVCREAFNACIAREDSKRNAECAASSVRCRQECTERNESGGAK